MKQILKLGILILAGFIAFNSSCTKDVFTEEDAFANQEDLELLKDSLATAQALLRDSLQKAGGIIDYSVGVALGSDASWYGNYYDKGGKGGQGLDGAAVTVSQHGKILTVTTGPSGIATFKDLRIGTVNVNVKKTGFTEVDFVALIPALPDTVYVNAYNIVRQVGTMVPVFSLTTNLSTISGIATVETDLTNNAPELAAGVKIAAVIDVWNSSFINRYIKWPYYNNAEQDCSECGVSWWFNYYGIIEQIAFHSVISEATTAADGSFSLQVPSSADGLPIQLIPSEWAANQSLLQSTLNNVPVWGVQTVRTLFGPDYTYSTVPTGIPAAYVTFSAPTGSPAAQPTTVATATAVLASSGIVSISMDSQGEGYTQVPDVKIGLGTAFNSVQAEGTAVMSGGKITGVNITSAGSGYKPGDSPTIAFTESVVRTAAAVPEFSFSVVDAVMSAVGSGYTQTPPAVTITGSGTGATAHAVMTATVTDVNMTNMGSGYTQTPLVKISDNFGALANGTAVMTTSNPLFSIDYDKTNTTLWPSSPVPTATVVGDGAGATANLTMGTVGKVVSIAVTAGGSGYSAITPPEVTLTLGGGFGATATATVVAGSVTAVNVVDQGQGYISIPTVSFSGGSGTGATAAATLGFPVETISLQSAGVGYTTVSAINVNNGGPNVDYSGECVVKYNRSVRDITVTAGNYFSAVPTITITPVDGNGSNAAATAVITWGIKDIEIDAMGSGYLDDDANDVRIVIAPPAGAGVQATATPTLGNGVLSKVVITEHGQGYTAAPNVYMQVTAPGVLPFQQALLTGTVAGGQLTGITIADPGAGYNFNSYDNGWYDIIISTYNSSAAATAKVNPKSGTIEYIQIDIPGAGYAVAPKIEINNATVDPANANGFGTGAAATATIIDGRVSAITVTNAGSGYYIVPVVTITVPWSSMTAVGLCTVNADGRITGVTFPASFPYTQGYGYDAPPTVTFTASISGKGTGAAGAAVVSGGRVTSVIMTNQGSGYIGKNNPGSAQAFGFIPTSTSFLARAGKAYVRDLNLGTGKRTIEQ
ncbi:MAG: hypothetical protein A2Z69_01265 [Bacteroidetes bacterium RBG_13_44_24]|nr:MAG: hypothetical protein A2Z69_01265 [Bacteroidetes bacterium RBG_13_44_24]